MFGRLRNLIVDVSLKLFDRDLAVLWSAVSFSLRPLSRA